jgi:hypothetical protein
VILTALILYLISGVRYLCRRSITTISSSRNACWY